MTAVSSRVVDLGAGANPDPRATETVDLHHPHADHEFDLTEEWPFEDASIEMFTAHHVFEHLPEPGHVMQEIARCLVDGGVLELTVPLGINADSDPDHTHQWTYDTPEIVVGDFKNERYWDTRVPLRLVHRDLDVQLKGPLGPLSPLYQKLSEWWPKWTAYNCDHGTLTATYVREARSQC